MSKVDGVKILEELLRQLASQADNDEELLKVWINIGERMGLFLVIPHIKVIIYEDENEERHPIGLIGSPEPMVIDYLTSPDLFPHEICEISLEALKNLRVGH